MKKAWYFLLLLLVSTTPAAQAQFDYTTNAGAITITNYSGPGGNVVIPSTLTGLPVTSIGINAFQGSSLGTVTIPDSVASIGAGAFFNTGLTNVTIPASVKSIGANAFAFCSLPGVTVPASVTNLGQLVFVGGYAMKAITVAAGNKYYSSADGVLFDARRATLLECPDGFTGNYAVPKGVTNIADEAFWSCGGVTGVTIPGSVRCV